MALILKYFVAGLVRYWLIHTDYWQTISNRVEIATPLNSWKRLIEGIYLYDHGIDPYEGDSFHESPIVLVFFHFMLKKVPYLLPLIFTLMDILTAHILYKTSKAFVLILEESQEKIKQNIAKESKTMLLNKSQLNEAPDYVLSVYLFNPYSVLNCVGMTSTVIQNLLVSVSLWGAASGQRLLACTFIALATHQALYPILLVVPISILLANVNKGCNKCSYNRTLLIFVLCWSFLIYISAYIMNGSYSYFYNTYGFILTVPDLKPNIGLFWYFFTEMFEHFRLLFVCAFQINALALYVVPLTLRFHKEPVLLATVLIALSTIFRSYPCVVMQQKFIVGCAFIITSVLGPTVWHLWIYSGSANANFFFGVTLSFATAQIFLITDLLFAYIKREFTLKHGSSRQIDGKPAKLVLR
ncbi:unnamed protein product [Euphydryas editha]|uniref:Phosphatidylinositol glycan anchor biosynthesis class U protein n=1 Tax=Euphydryas editha TaxID=104508 RepID=A0AAU9V0N2_EUPED|nr:unnamed protein product [Euphydryas editha]